MLAPSKASWLDISAQRPESRIGLVTSMQFLFSRPIHQAISSANFDYTLVKNTVTEMLICPV